MHLEALFEIPRVDWNRFRAALHERLVTALSEATRKYLEATAVAAVPVWSGASRATFSPLASHVSFALATMPVAGAPNRIDLGLANGTGLWTAGERQGVYAFTYSTTLPHLIINEYYNANTFTNPETGKPYFHLHRPGPYHFQEAGARAFDEVAATVRLPGWDAILDSTFIHAG